MFQRFGHVSSLFLASVILQLCTPESTSPRPVPGRLPRVAKSVCLMQSKGCACYARPDKQSAVLTRLFHNEAVIERAPDQSSSGFVPVARFHGNPIWEQDDRDISCFYPSENLRWQPPAIDRPASAGKRNHTPLDLRILFFGSEGASSQPAALQQLMQHRRRSLGKFWFTYYHLALEEHHPGSKVPVISPQGTTIGQASKEFLDQVRWEGSGLAEDGKKYHFTGIDGRYQTYDEQWGLGAGGGFEVFPYRTIAVNFSGFCSRLFPDDSARRERCRRGGVLGTALFIPEVADRHIPMEGGASHDGWFCATDTGSPSYIREDRIDIFVGAHGGGNPYLPASRQWNHFFAAGLINSVPWDWRLWRTETDRYWCDVASLPKNGEEPDPKRHCLHDFHTTTPEKALTIEVPFGADGQPLRCRNGREIRGLRKPEQNS